MSVPAGAYFAVGAGKIRWELDNAAHGFARGKPTLEQADHSWFSTGARRVEPNPAVNGLDRTGNIVLFFSNLLVVT